MSDRNLDDYVDVAERIGKFYEKFPDGRLTREKDWEVKDVGERTFIVYHALAYRTTDDPHPGQGSAWEPFPGATPFTRDSELMNAETASWGRAIAACGIEVRRGIATQQDVRARSGSNGADNKTAATAGGTITPNQLDKFVKRVAARHQLTDDDLDTLARAEFGVEAVDQLPKGRVDEFVKRMETGEPIHTGETDVPAPALPVGDPGPEEVPF